MLSTTRSCRRVTFQLRSRQTQSCLRNAAHCLCNGHALAAQSKPTSRCTQSEHQPTPQVINSAAKTWGLECLRYEIRDILPPPRIVRAMELQAEAERRKRAQVLESEGVRQATINESEARRVRPAW